MQDRSPRQGYRERHFLPWTIHRSCYCTSFILVPNTPLTSNRQISENLLTWVHSIFIGSEDSRFHRRKRILWNFSSAKQKCWCRIWSCYASSSPSQGCWPWRCGRLEWELWCGRKERLGAGEGGEEIWVLCHCLTGIIKHLAFSIFNVSLRARKNIRQSGPWTRRNRGKMTKPRPVLWFLSALKSCFTKLYF